MVNLEEPVRLAVFSVAELVRSADDITILVDRATATLEPLIGEKSARNIQAIAGDAWRVWHDPRAADDFFCAVDLALDVVDRAGNIATTVPGVLLAAVAVAVRRRAAKLRADEMADVERRLAQQRGS